MLENLTFVSEEDFERRSHSKQIANVMQISIADKRFDRALIGIFEW